MLFFATAKRSSACITAISGKASNEYYKCIAYELDIYFESSPFLQNNSQKLRDSGAKRREVLTVV